MPLLIVTLLAALLAPPPVLLDAAIAPLAPGGVAPLFFSVRTDAPRHFYAQVDTTDGLAASPVIFEFDLAPGATFAQRVDIAALPGATTESVRVRVWASDGGAGPAADTTVPVVVMLPHRVYLAYA